MLFLRCYLSRMLSAITAEFMLSSLPKRTPSTFSTKFLSSQQAPSLYCSRGSCIYAKVCSGWIFIRFLLAHSSSLSSSYPPVHQLIPLSLVSSTDFKSKHYCHWSLMTKRILGYNPAVLPLLPDPRYNATQPPDSQSPIIQPVHWSAGCPLMKTLTSQQRHKILQKALLKSR